MLDLFKRSPLAAFGSLLIHSGLVAVLMMSGSKIQKPPSPEVIHIVQARTIDIKILEERKREKQRRIEQKQADRLAEIKRIEDNMLRIKQEKKRKAEKLAKKIADKKRKEKEKLERKKAKQAALEKKKKEQELEKKHKAEVLKKIQEKKKAEKKKLQEQQQKELAAKTEKDKKKKEADSKKKKEEEEEKKEKEKEKQRLAEQRKAEEEVERQREEQLRREELLLESEQLENEALQHARQEQLKNEHKQETKRQLELQKEYEAVISMHTEQIKALVKRNVRCAIDGLGIRSVIQVRLSSGGHVMEYKTIDSSGNQALDRCREAALAKSGNLPIPKEEFLFEGYFRLFHLEFDGEK